MDDGEYKCEYTFIRRNKMTRILYKKNSEWTTVSVHLFAEITKCDHVMSILKCRFKRKLIHGTQKACDSTDTQLTTTSD